MSIAVIFKFIVVHPKTCSMSSHTDYYEGGLLSFLIWGNLYSSGEIPLRCVPLAQRRGHIRIERMAILTEADRAFFEENGYLVVPDVVPKENCDAVINTLFEFLAMERSLPEYWYRPPLRTGGMIYIYQHQTLWDNRQYPRLH